MTIENKAVCYGNDVDTDVIIPARYLSRYDDQTLRTHCMEDIDPYFLQKVGEGAILIAGENFGCGSSREHAPLALKAAGISCIVAKSFARIFFRNAVNIGLPILECDLTAKDNDLIRVDLDTGVVVNLTSGISVTSAAFPAELQSIIKKGGLLASLD